MPVGITQSELDIFKQNGLNDAQVKETINNYRSDGLSDADIRKKIDSKLTEFSSAETAPQQVGKNTYALGATKSYVGGKTQPSNLGALELPVDLVEGALPIVGSIGGGLAGLATGGPLGAIGGAGAGAGTGALLRRNIEISRGEKPFATSDTNVPLETLKYAGGEGIWGALGEATGLGVAKGASVGLPKLASKFPQISEFLQSVPQKYGEIALKAEQAGQSLFKDKFDFKTAYHPIEQKIIQARNAIDKGDVYRTKFKELARSVNEKMAKSMTPDSEIGSRFYDVGQKVLNGLETVKATSEQAIQTALNKLPNTTNINTSELLNDLNNLVQGYAKGGKINPAGQRASKEVDMVYRLLSEQTENGVAPAVLKPIDLHNIKEILYDMANYETPQGIKNTVIKNMATNINNKLRKISPEYADANDAYSTYKKIEQEAGGINPTTIANKLSTMSEKTAQMSGFNRNIQKVNALLHPDSRFLDDVYALEHLQSSQKAIQKNIGNLKTMEVYDSPGVSLETKRALETLYPEEVEQYLKIKKDADESKEILKAIGQKYQRNPRLLSNINDQETQILLQQLQEKSGINFLDDLEKMRARELYSKVFPGQGGGSGSDQGLGNIVRGSLITTSALKSPLMLPLASLFSPKYGGQPMIKSLGNIPSPMSLNRGLGAIGTGIGSLMQNR